MPGLYDKIPTLSAQQKKTCNAIRTQWQLFEKWLAASRAESEKRRKDVFKKFDDDFLTTHKPTRPRRIELDKRKSDKKRELDNDDLQVARIEWQRRLASAKLNPEDWLDMTPAELDAVERALGGETDNDNTQPPSQPPPPQYQSLPPNGRTTAHAPSAFASSTSHERVHPTEFRDERAFHDPLDSRPRNEFETFRTPDFPAFTQFSVSPEHSPPRTTSDRVPVPLPPSSASSSHQHSPVDHHDTQQLSKHRSAIGNRYIGPILHDPDDPIDEEADFELIKAKIRDKKIWEFHYAAAVADTKLAQKIRNLSSHDIKDMIAKHDLEMEQLQRDKEDERRTIVDEERAKRQQELRRRHALYNATAQPWKSFEAMVHMPADHEAEPSTRTYTPWHVPNSKPVAPGSEEIWMPREAWPLRGGSSAASGSSAQQSQRSDGSLDQKKKQPAQGPNKMSPKSSDKLASASSSHNRPDNDDDDKPLDVSRPRGKSFSRPPPEIRRPDGLEHDQDSTARKIPLGTDIWRPTEQPEPQSVLGASSSSLPIESLFASKTRQEAQQRQAAAAARPAAPTSATTKSGWVVHGSATKSKNGSSTKPSVQREPIVVASQEDPTPTILAKDAEKRLDRESTATSDAIHSFLSRPRQLSDPHPPPSPNMFEVSTVKKQVSESTADNGPKAPKSILKKSDRKAAAAAGPSKSEVVAPTPAAPAPKPPPEPKRKGKAGKKANAAPPTALAAPAPASAPGKAPSPLPVPAPVNKQRKPVTIEEVSDEEADPVVPIGVPVADQSPTSIWSPIIEPKPSKPPAVFSNIIRYSPEPSTSSAFASTSTAAFRSTSSAETSVKPAKSIPLPPVESRPTDIWYPPPDTESDSEGEEDGGWEALIPTNPIEEKSKHVRWTPSVLSNGGHTSSPDVSLGDALLAFKIGVGAELEPLMPQSSSSSSSAAAAARARPRGRAMSFEPGRSGFGGDAAADRVRAAPRNLKGKGKEKATVYDVAADSPEDDLACFVSQAMDTLKGGRP